MHLELLVSRQGEPFELELIFNSFLREVVLELTLNNGYVLDWGAEKLCTCQELKTRDLRENEKVLLEGVKEAGLTGLSSEK